MIRSVMTLAATAAVLGGAIVVRASAAAVPAAHGADDGAGASRASQSPGEAHLRGLFREAADTALPALARVNALIRVYRYYDPRRVFRASELMHFGVFGRSWIDHPNYEFSSSIHADMRDTIRSLLHRIEESERNDSVWIAAQRLSSLARRDTIGSVDGLIEAWRAAESPDAAKAVAQPSEEVADLRLLSAVQSVATDRGRPRAVRYSALHTLATMADPAMYAAGMQLDHDHYYFRCYGWWGWAHHHAVQQPGPHPFTRETPAEIAEWIADLGSTDPEPDVRRVARMLAGCIRADREQPVKPSRAYWGRSYGSEMPESEESARFLGQ